MSMLRIGRQQSTVGLLTSHYASAADWIGLVPKQISTGDQRGNRYLHVLFVQAAWVVLVRVGPEHWERYRHCQTSEISPTNLTIVNEFWQLFVECYYSVLFEWRRWAR